VFQNTDFWGPTDMLLHMKTKAQ